MEKEAPSTVITPTLLKAPPSDALWQSTNDPPTALTTPEAVLKIAPLVLA
jgi:hypothetical protein